MKKIISLILCVCLLLSAVYLPIPAAAEETEASETQETTSETTSAPAQTQLVPETASVEAGLLESSATITTEEEFRAIVNNPSGYYILSTNLTLSAETVAAMQKCYFTGTLDGNGYMISADITGIDDYKGAGLFNGIDGTVKNLTLQANMTLNTNGTLNNAGLLASNCGQNSYFYNCNVVGTISVSESSSSTYLVLGGLVGCGNGLFDNCTVEVDITVDTPSPCDIGGIVGSIYSGAQIRDSSFDGAITLTQTSATDTYYCVTGLTSCLGAYYSERCTVSGSLTVTTNYANGRVCGIWCANNSTNNATVNLTAANGSIYCAGAAEGNNLTNLGAVTMSINGNCTMGASGVMTASNSRNAGAVFTFAETGDAVALGVSGCTDSTNTGTVTAIASNGEALAIGCAGAMGANINEGKVTAEVNTGKAVAQGIAGTTATTDGCKNNADVSALAQDGVAQAWGLLSCANSENTGDVAAESMDDSESRVTLAMGSSGNWVINRGDVTVTGHACSRNVSARGVGDSSKYSVNYGKVTVTHESGHAMAIGVDGDYCKNYGEIYAHSSGPRLEDSGSAVVYGCTDASDYSYNNASLTAVSEHSAAYAYGAQASTSVSDGTATAISNLYEEAEDGKIYLGRVEASGSTRVRISNAGGSASASAGEAAKRLYLFSPTGYCIYHSGSSAWVTITTEEEVPICETLIYDGQELPDELRACYIYFGTAAPSAEKNYDVEVPEYEEGENDSDGMTALNVSISAYEHYDGTFWEHQVTALKYAEGNFSWEKANSDLLSDPDLTNYDELNLKLSVENRILAGDAANLTDTHIVVTLKAPDGFSFAPDAIVPEAAVIFESIEGDATATSNVALYPIYAEELPTSLAIDYTVSSTNNAAHSSAVSPFTEIKALDSQGIISYRNSFNEQGESRTLSLTSMDWSGFSKSSSEYNGDIAMLAAGLSAASYKYADMLTSLQNMGFSNIERCNYYLDESGNPIDTESKSAMLVACAFATKKIIVEDEVRTVVAAVVRGTLGEEWFSNFETGTIHDTFSGFYDAEIYVTNEFVTYMANLGLKDNPEQNKILITGHSRGGAVADLFADELMTTLRDLYASTENIYGYTFAAPNTKIDGALCSNIFNIVNFEDIVPRVPAGYKKTGINLVVGTRFSDSCDVAAFEQEFKSLTGFAFKNYGEFSLYALLIASQMDPSSLSIIVENASITISLLTPFRGGILAMVRYIANQLLNNSSDDVYQENGAIFYKTRQLLTVGDYIAAFMLTGASNTDPQDKDNITYNHAMETYIAWLKAMDGEEPRPYYGYGINCPVDVTVYDSSGTMVAQVIDNEVTYAGKAYCWVEDDSKQFILAGDEEYTFHLTGTDNGTMSVSITEYDDNFVCQQINNFYDVPVTKEETSIGAFGTAYSITMGDAVLYPDETLSGEKVGTTTVTIATEGTGSAYGAGSYTKGESIVVVAEAGEESTFNGWYVNGERVSTEEIYRFVVKDAMTLTAKFDDYVAYKTVSISLAGDIGLNYYVKLADHIIADPEARLEFTVADKVVAIPIGQAMVSTQDGETLYRFSIPLNTKQMADTVTAQMYTADGAVGEAKSYSVRAYCEQMINYLASNGLADSYGNLIWLLKTMLNYGAYAQLHFNYNTDDLANSILQDAEKELTDTMWLDAYTYSITGSEDGIQIYSASMLLESETTIRFYFSLTGSKAIDEYTFIVDGRQVTPTQSGALYYVDKPNVSAKNLDSMYTVSVGDLSITYGGLSYVKSVISYPDATETLVNVVTALYMYNQAANFYFSS